MADQDAKSSNDRQFRMMQLIYFAMLFSLVTYQVLGLWLRPTPLLSEGMQEAATFTQIFYFLSAAMIVSIFIVWERIYPRPSAISPSPLEISKQMSFYRMGHLLIYILCEVIGLFGLLLLFLTGSIRRFLNFTLVSIFMIVVLYLHKMAGSKL